MEPLPEHEGLSQLQDAQVKMILHRFARELLDALDSRIYWSREMSKHAEAAAVEDVKDAVQSAVEEALL